MPLSIGIGLDLTGIAAAGSGKIILPSTFDPTTPPKSTLATLSETNARVTIASGSDQGARSTNSWSSGKIYAEFEILNITNCQLGVISAAGSLTQWLSLGPGTIMGPDGTVSSGGNNIGASGIGAVIAGNILGVEIDIDGGTLEYAKNNVYGGSRKFISAGTLFLCAGGNAGMSVRLHTTAANCAFTPRSGYSYAG